MSLHQQQQQPTTGDSPQQSDAASNPSSSSSPPPVRHCPVMAAFYENLTTPWSADKYVRLCSIAATTRGQRKRLVYTSTSNRLYIHVVNVTTGLVTNNHILLRYDGASSVKLIWWFYCRPTHTAIAMATWRSVCLLRWRIVPKRLSRSSCDFHEIVAHTKYEFDSSRKSLSLRPSNVGNTF